ncbi:MAG: CoA transferase [Acidimicrobiia bacterium]|nr:CoA transferase [Acidimicrobiia bacterium]
MAGSAESLGGLTVLELGSGVASGYAGKLLADLGAEVTLLEPPGGSPLRRRPPFVGDRAGRADGGSEPVGAWFVHLAGAKRSIVAGEGSEPGGALAELVAGADVVLSEHGSPWGDALAAAVGPRQVEVVFSTFGEDGPYAAWRPSDLAVWALGGYLGFTGAPDREPLWLPGSQAALHAGVHGAFAALAALHERHRSGLGQRIEVAELDAVLNAHAWLVSSWVACGQHLRRQPCDLIRARDGWVYVMRIAARDELFVLIERPDLLAENLTADIPTWFANIPRIFDAVAEWAAERSVDEIVEQAQLLRVAVTPVLDAAAVAADPQLAARGWWELDESTGLRVPGQPYRLGATPSRRRGDAPRLGAHGRIEPRVPSAAHPGAGPPIVDDAAPVGAAPTTAALAGLRVVEVTTNWAGPSAGRFLADLGADVIKVEWATRPATRVLFWVGPDQDQQRRPHDRSMYFNELNRNKRSVCIDLSTDAGRDAFVALVRSADVLIENNSARVMPNLGLDWPALRAVNPGLVMVSMSGYGADGPRRDWVAYGANIEATSGLTSVTGYPDGQLSRTTLFYADPVTGVHGAVAVLAALAHRRRTGEGQWVELSLNECGAAFCAEPLLGHAATGEVPGPRANRDDRFAPHGVYPCAGADHWVAIACQDDDDWRELALLIGRPDLAADEGLAGVAGRQARHDELDRAIGDWTRTLEQYEAARACQARGISAAPVLANWQILTDPHIHRRAVYQPIEHPVVGVYPTTTGPWRFSRTPAQLTRPAPCFAEHNREVLAEAGLDPEEIDALYASGVTADEPAVG